MIALNVTRIRKRLGRDVWGLPKTFGPAGFVFDTLATVKERGRVIVTIGPAPDSDLEWLHASISRDTMPTYDDLVLLHRAVFGDHFAYQVFAPTSSHVNIHEHALHLWGRVDGRAVLPDFGSWGTI